MKAVKVKVKHAGHYPLPEYKTPGAAAMDLVAELPKTTPIIQGQNELIPTGLYVAIPEGYCGKIYARSGLADKKHLAPSNAVGIIDSDYRGQIYVSLANHGPVTQYIDPGERIAQLIIEPVTKFQWDKVDELPDTQRGIGGFGSTGTKDEREGQKQSA